MSVRSKHSCHRGSAKKYKHCFQKKDSEKSTGLVRSHETDERGQAAQMRLPAVFYALTWTSICLSA